MSIKRLAIILSSLAAVALPLASTGSLKLIAHRGGIVDQRYAENSAASLEAAIKSGYWMAEVDVRETKDGRLVVQHDPDFKRFYGVDRKVADMTWDEISRLRATPGNTRPIQFGELAKLARDRIHLMIDTKEPSHSAEFYRTMETALAENGLLSGAFFIGTEESRSRFKGKARVSATREVLQAALRRGEDVSGTYFLFEHGRTLDESGLRLAAQAKVPAVVSINVFHYDPATHMRDAQVDVGRLRSLGMEYFQIDSVYDQFFKRQ